MILAFHEIMLSLIPMKPIFVICSERKYNNYCSTILTSTTIDDRLRIAIDREVNGSKLE